MQTPNRTENKTEIRAKRYLSLINDLSTARCEQFVDSLSHAERIELRQYLELFGCQKLIRSLYYDYASQSWIE